MEDQKRVVIEAPEDNNPRPNPSRGVNPENDLYEAWKAAEAWERPEIESRLLQHLRRHAAKVCWMVLHSHQPHLVDEIAQDALMDLKSFQERCSFATWFHARALFRCRAQFRQDRRRKEVPLDGEFMETAVSKGSSLETQMILKDLQKDLTPIESELLQLKVYEGFSDEDVASRFGVSRSGVQLLWQKLRKKLKDKYHGKTS